MDLQYYIGRAYQEMELYELLLFEIEENFDYFFKKSFHFYFDRQADGKIKIIEMKPFSDMQAMDKFSRTIVEKREWFEIYENHGHVDLLLVRLDRTGQVSIVWEDRTHTQDWKLGWVDEQPPSPPMTPDEIRQAFRELCGFFEDEQEKIEHKSKSQV